MLHLKRVTASTVAAIALALPASAAAQGYQDLRGEHARDAARQAEIRSQPKQDLRNADRRVPDTGVRVPPLQPPAPEVRVVTTRSDGFDWGDAGIGAVGGLALITLAGGTAAIATHRRRSAAVS
jgi:hypothetical protein